MYIADVIGSLRAKDLELQKEIHTLRLAVHLLEYRLSTLSTKDIVVSRETLAGLEDLSADYTQPSLFDEPKEPPSSEADLGKSKQRGRRAPGRPD